VRVVIVTDSYPPVVNGVSTVTSWLASRLAGRGHDVTVITSNVSTAGRLIAWSNGVRVVGISVFPRGGYRAPLGVLVSPEARSAVDSVLRRADVVHAHNIHSLFAPLIALLGGASRLVFQPHYGGRFFRGASRLLSGAYRRLALAVSRRALTHVFVSLYERATYRAYLGDPGVDGVVIPNPVPDDAFSVAGRAPPGIVVTYAGRLDYYKHPEIVALAAEAVAERLGERVTVKLVGSGPALRRVLQVARRLERVEVVVKGGLPRDEYLRELAASSVLILPSEGEAYGIVVGEALAAGVPVVVPRPWGLIWRQYCPGRVFIARRYDDVSDIADKAIAALGARGGECALPREDEVYKLYEGLLGSI